MAKKNISTGLEWKGRWLKWPPFVRETQKRFALKTLIKRLKESNCCKGSNTLSRKPQCFRITTSFKVVFLPSRCSLIFNVWLPACLPSLQAQISSKSLSFKRRHSWEVVIWPRKCFHLFEFPIFLHHCYNIHKKSQLRRLTLLSDKDTWPGASEIVSKVIGQHLTRGE